MASKEIIPYTSVFIDAKLKHFLRAAQWSVLSPHDHCQLIRDLQAVWSSDQNRNSVLPCLSARTGLDLFLRVMNYPPGTEVVMSAINIPDIAHVVHAHQLKIIALDVELETMAPKLHLLRTLVSERTKVLLVANIFGRRFDMEPVIAAARAHGLVVIEDAAEGFSGFDYYGCPDSDLALFSFGPIKYFTAFGGGIAKVRDQDIFNKMSQLYELDPVQSRLEYLKKVIKYSIVCFWLNNPGATRVGRQLSEAVNFDVKKFTVSMLRGFPDKLMQRLRQRPCDALLAMMRLRFEQLDAAEISLTNVKHEYVIERLPTPFTAVGTKADTKNHWLFPVIVDNPDEMLKALNDLGVDAYRGATQLSVIESDNGDDDHALSHICNLDKFFTKYPHEAKYLIDHVLYLPVNKLVPFRDLDRICRALSVAVATTAKTAVPHVRVLPEFKSKL